MSGGIQALSHMWVAHTTDDFLAYAAAKSKAGWIGGVFENPVACRACTSIFLEVPRPTSAHVTRSDRFRILTYNLEHLPQLDPPISGHHLQLFHFFPPLCQGFLFYRVVRYYA
jgi:hypothetical protein